MTDYTVHIVDDEEPGQEVPAFMLTMNGFAVKCINRPRPFWRLRRTSETGSCHGFENAGHVGVELLRNLGDRKINVPSIVITGHGDVPMAVEAMKAGAVDFIEKPFEDTVIIEAIERASEHLVAPQADADEVNDIRARPRR